jgi:hypothetical protein
LHFADDLPLFVSLRAFYQTPATLTHCTHRNTNQHILDQSLAFSTRGQFSDLNTKEITTLLRW